MPSARINWPDVHMLADDIIRPLDEKLAEMKELYEKMKIFSEGMKKCAEDKLDDESLEKLIDTFEVDVAAEKARKKAAKEYEKQRTKQKNLAKRKWTQKP